MKIFFNANEKEKHVFMCALYSLIDDFKTSDALTVEEKRCLNKAEDWLLKFNKSVFERFGSAYVRKIENTAKINNVTLVGKYAPTTQAITECATEDLLPKLKDLQMFSCMDCEKCDFKDCAVYSMLVSCGFEGKTDGKCPYEL